MPPSNPVGGMRLQMKSKFSNDSHSLSHGYAMMLTLTNGSKFDPDADLDSVTFHTCTMTMEVRLLTEYSFEFLQDLQLDSFFPRTRPYDSI